MSLIRLLFTFLFIVSLVACTGDFDEINTNPATVTKDVVNQNNIFTYVLKQSIFDSYEYGYVCEYSGYYANPSTSPLANRDWSDPFNNFYRTYLINIAEVIRLTEGREEFINQNSMARIWKVWLFHQLTDLYGDVPYFEAALAVEEVVNYPKYDTQEDIYKDMLNELEEAEAALTDDTEKVSFGAYDLIYNGDVDSWRRFANSLRLRLAMRIRFVAPDLARENVLEVLSKPLITENSQNAYLETEGESAAYSNNRNPLYNRYLNNTTPINTTNTVTDNLLLRDDPRLEIYVIPATDPDEGAEWRGRPFALDLDMEGNAPNDSSWYSVISYSHTKVATLGTIFHAAQYTIKILSASEVSFLRTEAALAGITAESAPELWENGIRLAMEMYNVDADEVQAYVEAQLAVFESKDAEGKLEEIIVQKWLGNYYQSKEAWAEYRRTGYPLIWVGKMQGDTDGKIPRRLTYPAAEYLKNEDNVTDAANRLSQGDTFLSKVWWDVRPGLPFDHPKQGTFPPELYVAD